MTTSVTHDIDAQFFEKFPKSAELFAQAQKMMPGGVSHSNRLASPFPLYVDRAEGPFKWDVDGNQFLDYGMGSASLLLGHSSPTVVSAIRTQLEKGTGATSCHELEIEWAGLVRELVPCAEMVRFAGTGTEATLLALRSARAYTGRDKVVRFQGHFHGWHDYAVVGLREPYERAASAGIPNAVEASVLAVPNDAGDDLEAVLAAEDVAAVILEPSGARWGSVPVAREFLIDLRALTSKYGTLLIFDEMITGFRYAPGGAQARSGVTPDLATFGKILTGGLPGAAVAGRKDVLDLISPLEANNPKYVFHWGTFNANTLSAAAGIATLREVRTGVPDRAAEAHAEALRNGLANIFEELSIPGYVYGESSIFHVYMQKASTKIVNPAPPLMLLSISPSLIKALQHEVRLRGVDLLSYNGGVASAVHGGPELDRALEVFRAAFQRIRDRRLFD